ncbi:MAG: hypothetical protein ACOC4I_06275 [Spirochaetota bacterium]
MKGLQLSCFMCISLLILAAPVLFAEDENTIAGQELNRDRFPEALGFQYGQISGAGLSYHRWYGSTGVQIAGGILYFPVATDTIVDFVLDYSLGVQVNSSVFASDYSDRVAGQLYLIGGVSHRGFIEREFDDGIDQNSAGPFIPSIGVGAGLGIEIVLFEHFSIPIELLYAGIWEGSNRPFVEQIRIDLTPQAGFRYRY